MLKWSKLTDNTTSVVLIFGAILFSDRLPTLRRTEGTLVDLTAAQQISDPLIGIQFDVKLGQQTTQ